MIKLVDLLLEEGADRFKKLDYSDTPILQQYLDKYWGRIIKQMESAVDRLNKNELWNIFMPKITLTQKEVNNEIISMFDQIYVEGFNEEEAKDFLNDGDPNDKNTGYYNFEDQYLVYKSWELKDEIDYDNMDKFLQLIEVAYIEDDGRITYLKDSGGKDETLGDLFYDFYPEIDSNGLWDEKDAFREIHPWEAFNREKISKKILQDLRFID